MPAHGENEFDIHAPEPEYLDTTQRAAMASRGGESKASPAEQEGENPLAASILGGVALIFVFSAVAIAWRFGSASRIAPLVIGVPLVFLLVLETHKDLRRHLRARAAVRSTRTVDEHVRGDGATELALFVWFALLSALVLLFGFYVAIVAFTALFLRYGGRHSVRLAVVHAVLSALAFYVLMEMVLRLRVFKGLLNLF